MESSDIAYVQVEAVLAQCDLYLNEGAALQEDREGAALVGPEREKHPGRSGPAGGEVPQGADHHARCAGPAEEDRTEGPELPGQRPGKEAQSLDEENYVFTNRAQDLVQRAVREINADGRYKLIINANALIDADSTLNITPAVLETVNRLYAADKKNQEK